MIDTNTLKSILRSDACAALSDAEAAALVSTPVKTPKSGMVTYTTCAAVWGTVAAATFRAKMKGAVAAGQAVGASDDAKAFGAIADYIDTLLAGTGIDPSNPEVPTQSAAFVAAGIATQEQVDGVFFNISLPAGDVVSEADVAAARAAIVREDAGALSYQPNVDKWNAYSAAFEAWRAAGYPEGSAPADL